MKVTLNTSDNELPLWNSMFHCYLPVQKHIVEAGMAAEKSALELKEFQESYDEHDEKSYLQFQRLSEIHSENVLRLAPFLNQWAIARHGFSLN